ncbi:hypothetical protein Q9Q95_07315 [Sphingomonas sp. DG1-23]|uniref:hypothetical protein n=1 Tax=Sphingomonas sp. DG1-23 TaxID=3068316 RepID=UPI00273E8679|nr:hypothetical protein [Sphingomonas sp. DG1-23]MDP5278729.1 hypothetical protein [Sphingomonas sp. DG1-23]
MRNPERLRNLTLVAGLAGLLSVSIPFVDSGRAEEGAWVVVGGMIAVIGLGAAILLTLNLRRMRRLNAGEGVIARWQIDPATWARFVADDREAERDKRRLNNAIRLREKPRRVVAVVIGDDCLQVDGDFHRVALAELKGAGLSAGPPSILELRFVTPGAQQPDMHYAFRFPVAFGAETAARGVIDHYNRRYNNAYGAR